MAWSITARSSSRGILSNLSECRMGLLDGWTPKPPVKCQITVQIVSKQPDTEAHQGELKRLIVIQ